jgi:hypothetical protein
MEICIVQLHARESGRILRRRRRGKANLHCARTASCIHSQASQWPAAAAGASSVSAAARPAGSWLWLGEYRHMQRSGRIL